MTGEWRKLERRCSWWIYQRRSGGTGIEGSGRGIGSRSRREGWVAATHSDSEPGFPWSLLSWQHDTERLKAAAPYNFREHVAKTTECIQDTRWQAVRTWGYARNPLFKVSYQGWLNHCCLPCLMPLTFIFLKKSTWMHHSWWISLPMAIIPLRKRGNDTRLQPGRHIWELPKDTLNMETPRTI